MYPTYRFNKAGAQLRVEDEAEDRALHSKGEWFDHPPASDEAYVSPFANENDTDDTDLMVEEEKKKEASKKKK